ncbi:immediate early response gene 5-like protein [Nelusetta ayraudi]|uniref:immediate early response gene 5-like protein n=1 Tax=Nelusetta ayraudi TaxID=303726 RepID=UPI003F6F3C7C
MINTMECAATAAAADAQSLISISLMKIHNSRTQRGGIKLHKNLLVSYVLRNARQVYIKEKYAEIYRMQQYEEVMAVCNEIQELDPLELRGGEEEQQLLLQEQEEEVLVEEEEDRVGLTTHGRTQCALEEAAKEPHYYRSCCMEAPAVPHCELLFAAAAANSGSSGSAHCNKTTVLDLDTHVVTTVENGYLHQDCCCQCGQGAQSPAKKRKVEFGYCRCHCCCCCGSSCGGDAEETDSDFTASRKRAKRDECSSSIPTSFTSSIPTSFTSSISSTAFISSTTTSTTSCYTCPDYTDTSNISNLISIFGSGFTGLLSRQPELEQICSKQVLAGLGAWTRAIVAF